MLAKHYHKPTKPRPTYKAVIESHRIKDLEVFLHALERAWSVAKREGIPITISKCIEALRHR